jgi:hypothetical protein
MREVTVSALACKWQALPTGHRMNNAPNPGRRFVNTGSIFIMVGCAVGLALVDRMRSRHALDATRQELAALRAELERRDRALHPARAAVDAAVMYSTPTRDVSAPSDLQIDLFQQLTELRAQQSNTAALIGQLVAKTLGSPEQVKRGTQAAIQTLQASAQKNQQQLETARQRAAALVADLNIPLEIATMDPTEALDKVSLREYWPFFEAKREGDIFQELAERLRRRIIQERVDGATNLGDVEALAQEGRQQLESVRQRAKDLLTSLNVPPDVSTMDANKALHAAALRPYWPFFEAKRERELLQTVGDQLQRRLVQEQINAAVAAAKAGSQ